jgi:hypothetical protein
MHMSNPTDPVRINHELPAESWGAFCADVLAAYVATLPPGAKRPLTIAALVPLALCVLAVYLGLSSRVLPDRWRMALARACPPGRRPAEAQTDLLDFLTLPGDPTPGAFVSFSRLRADEPRIECDGYGLDIGHVSTEEDVARVAFAAGWGALPESRGLVHGVRLLPPSLVVPWCAANPASIVRRVAVGPPQETPTAVPQTTFVSLVQLRSGTVAFELEGRALTLHGCRVPSTASARAVDAGWSVTPAVVEGQPGLLFALATRITAYEETDDSPVCGVDCAKDHSMPARDIDGPAVDPDHEAVLRDTLLVDPPTNPATPSALQASAPVCPRCLDIAPGVPAGDPTNPHPGPFADEARDWCECAIDDGGPSEFCAKSNATMTRDDKAEARAKAKAKASASKSTKKSKPSGAEGKIRKGKDRAAK